MEMSTLAIILLIVAFLVLGLLVRFKRNRYVNYIGLAGAVFFLVYAFVNGEYMYPCLFFFIIFGYLSGKALAGEGKKKR